MSPHTARARRPITLGQIMAWVALLGSVCSLRATVSRFAADSSHQFLVGILLGSYILYVSFLALASSAYLTRTQILVLAAITAAIAALLFQTLVDPSGIWGLTSVLLLPFVPVFLGGWQMRRNRRANPDDVPPPETETLSTLVASKRQRGLLPQAAPAAPDMSLVTRHRLKGTWARVAFWRSKQPSA